MIITMKNYTFKRLFLRSWMTTVCLSCEVQEGAKDDRRKISEMRIWIGEMKLLKKTKWEKAGLYRSLQCPP
ncbi:hypothetical protein HanRHA438_Chr10g0446061 [Helianthus annuus]|nr:hypothetical protein HanIR_Chr10g0467781 [Helianthus annuus]KAJ0878972.1 hypothetical protein HanRHA438_Chr10g0446061 [Helianthus annuus]